MRCSPAAFNIAASPVQVALLTGSKRSASVRAKEPTMALVFHNKDMLRAMEGNSALEMNLWENAAIHIAENCLASEDTFKSWTHKKLVEWLRQWHLLPHFEEPIE